MSSERIAQDVVLVSMPWANVRYPSIQLGIIQSVLERAGFKVASLSAYTLYCDHLIKEGILKDWKEYNEFIEIPLIVEWVFAESISSLPRRMREKFTNHDSKIDFKKLSKIKRVTKPFLTKLANLIGRMNPKIVGFTTTFQQTVASLALSKIIKSERPDVQIILGGASCEGESGEALISKFPWVDVVLHGEAESVIGTIIENMLQGTLANDNKGVSIRSENSFVFLNGLTRNTANIKDMVIPDYDEYFRTIETTIFSESIKTHISLPFENSRGCWWGQKHQCRFCALNGELKFRSKPQDQALEDLKTLADKYQQHEFHCVDNILHEQHYRDFLNQLSSDEYDLSIFFEVKSNIKLTDLIRLKKAGVWCIQPGIESLSTEILKLMNKGVTGIQNIRLLKFCAWLDIGVSWNLLYGFPGEPQDEYTRIADLMKSIYHFQPPNLSVLALQKTSYYYNNAIQVGLKILGPSSFYKALYGPGNGELKKIATFFDYEHVDGRDPSVYINKVKKELKKWKSKWPASKEMLSYYCTKEKVTIIDKRIHLTPSIYKLDPLESYIYKQCFDIISLDKLAQNEKLTSVGLEIEDIEQFCRSLIDKRLMYREGNQLLALAVPTRKPTQLRMWSVDHDNTD